MSPTVISRGERVCAIIREEQSGVFELTEGAFLRAAYHPRKLGHRLSKVVPDDGSTNGLKLEIHIGTFTENNPSSLYADRQAPRSCKGFVAQWIPQSKVPEFSARMSKTSQRRRSI